jgi:hypothetical protein
MISTLAAVAFGFRSARSAGRNRLTTSTTAPRSRIARGGSSKLWSWTSSSLTTPEIPSREVELPIPEREAPMASISSMKPIAPPSLRAAVRSALK